MQLRVYAPPDMVERTEYPLNISVRILSRYEDLFGMPYSLPKLGTPPMNIPASYQISTIAIYLNITPMWSVQIFVTRGIILARLQPLHYNLKCKTGSQIFRPIISQWLKIDL